MIVFGGLVAQSVEQCPFKALVESSSLSQPTSLRLNAVKAKAATPKRSAGGRRTSRAKSYGSASQLQQTTRNFSRSTENVTGRFPAHSPSSSNAAGESQTSSN